MILLLLLLIELTKPITGLLALPGLQDQGVHDGPCILVIRIDETRILQSIPLEAIPAEMVADGRMFRKTISLPAQQGQKFWLRGDALDATFANDDIKILAQPSGKTWTYDQHVPAEQRRIISVTKSHNITSVFVEGDNTLTIEIIERLPPAQAYRDYWLVIEKACSHLPKVTAVPPSPTPSPTATATPTMLPTATATAIPTVTPGLTAQVVATDTAEAVRSVATPSVSSPNPRHPGRAIVLALIAIFVLRKLWKAR